MNGQTEMRVTEMRVTALFPSNLNTVSCCRYLLHSFILQYGRYLVHITIWLWYIWFEETFQLKPRQFLACPFHEMRVTVLSNSVMLIFSII